MPHQCTHCGSVFPDGSKEMLSGCPDCGGSTFQYIPEGADPADFEPESTEPPEPPISEDSVTGKVGRAASTVRDYVNARSDPDPTDDETEPVGTDESADANRPNTVASESTAESTEDRAQAAARGDVADLSELTSSSPSETSPGEATSERAPEAGHAESNADARHEAGQTGSEPARVDPAGPPREDGRVVDEPDAAANTDLDTLRAELNDQFESIRIVEPGQYELNLMELYDREEHIIALQEDGKYKIEVPDTWREGDEPS